MPTRFFLFLPFALLLSFVIAACSLVDGGDDAPPDAAPTADAAGTGTIIITVDSEPAGQAGGFLFTGVPSGTIGAGNSLVVADLAPGTYTTTQADPAPDFDLGSAVCADDDSSADARTRTAVVNLAAGETVTCTFTNVQRGSVVVVGETEPAGAAGQFQYTGVPSGTVPAGGTLVVAQLPPGTYTTTQVDPAPRFDLAAVTCDDGGRATVSAGDPVSRSAIFQVDPGELVTCTFVNTRRGSAVVAAVTEPPDAAGSFQFTGVPSGTLSAGGTLVVADLAPGTYTTTAVDPAPDFELTDVSCDDAAGGLASSGDAATRSAIFNVDAGELVTCTFTFTQADDAGPGGGGAGDGGDGGGINPFEEPTDDFDLFPLPGEIPPDAGTYLLPREGNWLATNLRGQVDCGVTNLPLEALPPEAGVIDVAADGQSLTGIGVTEDGPVSLTLFAQPPVNGRFMGANDFTQDGIPVTLTFVWQVVTPEYIVGYLTSAFSAEGVSCSLYRPFDLVFTGE